MWLSLFYGYSIHFNLNAYMPCDTIDDGECIDVLNFISQTLYKYNHSHVIFAGDINVDVSRTSRLTSILLLILICLNALIYLVQ